MGAFGESELSPLAPIPDGWTPASEPPSDDRNVRVTLNDGREWYGWWSVSFCKWRVYEDDANEKTITSKPEEYCSEIHEADDGEVIAWREIEPERKADPRVRYAVTREGKPDGYDFDKENCYRTYDDAVTSAKKNFYAWDKQHVEVWKLVAIVNPPAEPEVVKLEE